jgi:hypothetical protein
MTINSVLLMLLEFFRSFWSLWWRCHNYVKCGKTTESFRGFPGML